jgi:uncharacterized protein (TIGR03083 family)
MDREQLLRRVDRPWQAFQEAFRGLETEFMTAQEIDGWSVKDLIGHVSSWEEEALKALPLILEGRRPPPYNGIDRFNAGQIERRRALSLASVVEEHDERHSRLLRYLGAVPESAFATETRFRHRLRLDTYSHYPEHTEAILAWRKARGR